MVLIKFIVQIVFLVALGCDAFEFNGSLERRLEEEANHVVNIAKLHAALDTTVDDTVDAKIHQMVKVYHTGNTCPFKRKVISKMKNGEKVKILIVGGSVTYGAELRNRMGERWSNSFTQLLNSGWYKGEFEIVNMGAPACNIDVWINRVGEMKSADIIIMDLSVNDQGFELQLLPHLYKTFIQLVDNLPNHPALLFNYAFRTGGHQQKELTTHCPAEPDHGSCCNGVVYCKRWWDMQDFVTVTLNRYKVPFISYRDLVWPEYSKPPDNLGLWWNGLSHPDYKAHKMFAKLIATAFMMQVKESHFAEQCELDEANGKYVSGADFDETVLPVCAAPLTFLRAGESPVSVTNFVAHSSTGGEYPAATVNPLAWRYFNDSQLKYGWILEAQPATLTKLCEGKTKKDNEVWCGELVEQSIISFPVELSSSPRIQVNFLKSYTATMGTIAVWIDDKRDKEKSEVVHINSHWNDEYSVAHTVTISPEPLKNISTIVVGESALMSSLNPGKHILNFALSQSPHDPKQGFKFKLIGITAC